MEPAAFSAIMMAGTLLFPIMSAGIAAAARRKASGQRVPHARLASPGGTRRGS